MRYLFGVTIIWAFSFSLIGVYLSGYVDAWFSVLMRIGIATMVFLPFMRLKKIKAETKHRAKRIKEELNDVGAAIKEVGNQIGDLPDAAKGKTRKGRK